MTNHYEAILFDFDGVLIDSEPVHYQCWREILSPYGFELDWKTYEDNCVGISDRTMLDNFCNAAGPRLQLEQLTAEYPRKKALFRERIVEAEALHAETLELLRSLGDYRLAVVSSSNRTEVEPSLIRFGIRNYFRALVCGSEAPRLKPAPDPYLKAAEMLGVRRALVVEDSAAGEQSGLAAGFNVVRVRNPGEVAAQVRLALAMPDNPR